MKSVIQAVIVAAALAAPVAVFAQSNQPQSNQPITRAQVRAELIELEKAGYRVGDGDNAHYPDAIQAAEAKVAAQHGATSGYGGVVSGSADAGRAAVSKGDWDAMYSHP